MSRSLWGPCGPWFAFSGDNAPFSMVYIRECVGLQKRHERREMLQHEDRLSRGGEMSREAGLWTDGNPSALGMAPLRYYATRDGAPMEPRSNRRAII